MPKNIRTMLYEFVKHNTVCTTFEQYMLYKHAKKMLSMCDKDVMIEYYNKHIKDKKLSY